ncbi:ExbD/TolR family protein [Flavisolibacter nicotianae]|uniref:ExbD/TolR family protein n=1 Tax=Flavisolibacter nicotianae TaxID=2364882 RepID=UPI000EB13363|nr:biopolymer transporter ExbD [Flavisolibacter nicotianae]
MASIDSGGGDSGHKKGPGVKKAKKLSTRVDMTPMVDLGFLLITFFIFTATMSTPTTMRLIMPKDEKNPENQTEVKESGALTILMGKSNGVYYYEGQLKPDGSNFMSTTYADIRNVIQKKRTDVMQLGRSLGYAKDSADKDMVVVIKPNAEATYKNTVDILDEMTINNIKRFALVDISEPEKQAITLTEQRNGVK